jgi:orotate phosphoribosyltransferase
MEAYQKEFLVYIHSRQALRFGSFQTKSGRQSPYFFNAGGLFDGSDLLRLGEVYAAAIEQHFGEIDIVYGPAYKGIPLSVVAVSELNRRYGRKVAYCFNRKEAKEHGEKGLLVGRTPTKGLRVVIVDDVITAGTSVRETMELLSGIEGLEIRGILVALDRQERGMDSQLSATQEVAQQYGCPVKSITSMSGVLELLEKGGFGNVDKDILERVKAYRAEYGVS